MKLVEAEIQWVLGMEGDEFRRHCLHCDDLTVRKQAAIKLFKRFFKELDDDRARSRPALEILAPYFLGDAKNPQVAIGLNTINPLELIRQGQLPAQQAKIEAPEPISEPDTPS